MATTKSSTVSNKKKSANNTLSTLINLPQSIREDGKLHLQQKVLLNYYLGLREIWGDTFFHSNGQVVRESGVSEGTVKSAKKLFVERNYFTTAKDGKATIYTFNSEKMAEWDEEKYFERMNISKEDNEAIAHPEKAGQSGRAMKLNNTLNDNELSRAMNQGNEPGQSEEGKPQSDPTDDNQNDDNAMTRHEMTTKIFEFLQELNAKMDALNAKMDALSESNTKEHKELADSTAQTASSLKNIILQVVNEALGGWAMEHSKQGNDLGNEGSSETLHCPTITYTTTNTTTKTTNNVDNTTTNVELRSSRVAHADTHAQEAGVGCGVCDGGNVETQSAMPTTHDTNDGTLVGCGVGLDGNKNTSTSTHEEQAQAIERFNAINAEIDFVFGVWSQMQDTPTAQTSLKTLCNELRAIRKHLPSDAWLSVKNKIDSIRMTMAQAPTQTPQQISQRRNQLVSECFAKMDSIIDQWHHDNREQKGQIADVAIGQLLKFFYAINASEKQTEIVNRKLNDFYIKQRGFDYIPTLENLLSALTPPKTTQRLSELILKREDAQVINSSAEWVKRRQNASESVLVGVSDDVVNQTIGGLIDLVVNAGNKLRQFPNEATRMFEQAKSGLRVILAESDKWASAGELINRKVIAPIIAFETKKTDDASVLAVLTDIALNCEVKYIQEDVLTVIYAALRYNLSDAVRGTVTKMRLDVENKINGVGEFAPKDEKPAEKPTTDTSTEDDEDEMPF